MVDEPPHWRLLRAMREQAGAAVLHLVKPAPLGKRVASQIKSDQDARGRRRGSAEN